MLEKAKKLPERGREVFTLYYRDGMTLTKIGEKMGCNESSTSKICARALKSLLQMISKEDSSGDGLGQGEGQRSLDAHS